MGRLAAPAWDRRLAQINAGRIVVMNGCFIEAFPIRRRGRRLKVKLTESSQSSPKRITAKKARKSPPPRLSFSARLLRIHALTVKKHHNLLIGRHLPNPAFYSAVFQNALAGAL